MYTKQEMDEHLGTLPSSDTDLFPSHKPAKSQATQSAPNIPANLVNTLDARQNRRF